MESFGKFCLGFLLVIINTIITGLVISKFWLWFIVPVFNVPTLTIITAIGLSLFIGLLNFQLKKNKSEDFWSDSISLLISKLLLLLIGWLFFVIFI